MRWRFYNERLDEGENHYLSAILVVLLSQCFTAFAATAPILSRVSFEFYQIEISEDITKGEFEQHLRHALNDDQF